MTSMVRSAMNFLGDKLMPEKEKSSDKGVQDSHRSDVTEDDEHDEHHHHDKAIPKRFLGTYKMIDNTDWIHLKNENFGDPDWLKLYPLNSKGQVQGLLSPRMACKLFYDGVYILDKSMENEKYLQDRIPEACHKFYKKKQWRKQFIESGRRVCMKLAKGMNFSPNCAAEECFVHVIMRETFELGWRRVAEHIESLPETDKDKDFNRVIRLACNDEIANLYKMDADNKEKAVDYKMWFKAYHNDEAHMHEHEISV
jgi:hypothetical protein